MSSISHPILLTDTAILTVYIYTLAEMKEIVLHFSRSESEYVPLSIDYCEVMKENVLTRNHVVPILSDIGVDSDSMIGISKLTIISTGGYSFIEI